MFRRPFRDLIERQLALFEREHAALLARIGDAERAYDRADRAEAPERYADYRELVEEAGAELAGLRDAYAATLAHDTEAVYADAFNRAASRRWPRLEPELT